MARPLKDAGAVPYVKTAFPATLLSFESTNGVWGVCKTKPIIQSMSQADRLEARQLGRRLEAVLESHLM